MIFLFLGELVVKYALFELLNSTATHRIIRIWNLDSNNNQGLHTPTYTINKHPKNIEASNFITYTEKLTLKLHPTPILMTIELCYSDFETDNGHI